LGFPKGRGWRATEADVFVIEELHQLRGGKVVHSPQADEEPGRASHHEGLGKTHKAFSGDLFAKACLAGTQDDQVGGQIKA